MQVISGSKPAALGFWKLLPNDIYKQELLPVYGRYYKYAIAHSKENLNALVIAYYLPISAHADFEVGKALGYSDRSIQRYISKMKYKDPKKIGYTKHLFLKTRSAVQKMGWKRIIIVCMGFICGDKIVRNVLKKEGIYESK